MFKMTDTTEDSDDPSSRRQNSPLEGGTLMRTPSVKVTLRDSEATGLFHWVKNIVKSKADPSLRETIEEYIDAAENGHHTDSASITTHERTLISNVLKMRDHTAVDVMIPRADIFAIDIKISQKELLSLLADKQFSRIPVYRDSLDDVVGTIHIKDILGCLARGKKIDIEDLIRDVPIVSPAMPVLDLLLMMKQMRKHMALVVDEFGGIDGLVTINDVIESIVGEIEDEYDQDDEPEIIQNQDGSLIADARVDIEEFEERYGALLSEDEREDIDTLGGLVFSIAGRVPARGEILTHPSGMIFEIVDADPRRINRLLIKNIPLQAG